MMTTVCSSFNHGKCFDPDCNCACHERRKLSKFEDEILDLIDNRDDFTRSDLQGIVSAIVRKIRND